MCSEKILILSNQMPVAFMLHIAEGLCFGRFLESMVLIPELALCPLS